jgi:hypothetical protein
MFHVSDCKNMRKITAAGRAYASVITVASLGSQFVHIRAFLVHKNVTPSLLRLTATQIILSVNCSDRYGFKTEEDSCDADRTRSEKRI